MPPDTYHQSWGAAPRYEDAINPQYARRIPNTIPANTPYMGAGSRLSQVWFNRWTVLLLLIIVRVVLATISLNGDLDTAREKAFSACTSVESMGSAMASMPFYMAPGVNEMTAKSIEAAVSALKQTMLLMLTGVQEMVVFYTNLIISTYVCLITLVVNGSVGLLVDALKDITDFVNGAMTGILDGAEGEMKNFTGTLNKVIHDFVVGLGSFGVDIKGLPTLSIPSLNKLKNGLTIPNKFKSNLDNLVKNLPDFNEVKKMSNNATRAPFQSIIVSALCI